MSNPQIWGDWPLWGNYPLWSSGSTAALALRMRLAADIEATKIAHITSLTTLDVALAATSEKIGYQAVLLTLEEIQSAELGTQVDGGLEIITNLDTTIWPIVYMKGRSALVPDDIRASTERLGPVRKESFWGGGYRSIIYQTGMAVPGEAEGATLKLVPYMEDGAVSLIEYGYGRLEPMWREDTLWGTSSLWGYPDTPREWLVWGNGLEVHAGEYVMVRLHTAARQAARVCDLEWVFDVEDARWALNDVAIPAGGTRVNVPRHYFRWISIVNFGLQYNGGNAVTAAWVDKGIVEDGGVVEGPFIVCMDKDGNRVDGSMDITLQGARGKNYGDMAE